MQKTILLILPLLFCFGCMGGGEDKFEATEVPFNEAKWKTKKGRDYPFRDRMLGDLMSDEKIRELKSNEILNLLGKPARTDSSYLFYMITQKRIGFWPLHTKSLVIKFSEDSTINWMKIHE